MSVYDRIRGVAMDLRHDRISLRGAVELANELVSSEQGEASPSPFEWRAVFVEVMSEAPSERVEVLAEFFSYLLGTMDSSLRGPILMICGTTLRAVSEFEAAFRLFSRAADAFAKLNQGNDELLARVGALDVALRLDQTELAGEIVAVVLPRIHEASTAAQAQFHLKHATLEQTLGQVAKSLDKAERALCLRDSLDELELRGELLDDKGTFRYHVALAARDTGNVALALQHLEAAHAEASATSNESRATFLLSEIGITWQKAGELSRAEGILNSAARSAQSLGRHDWVERWSGLLPDPEDLETQPIETDDPIAKCIRAARDMYNGVLSAADARQTILESIKAVARGARTTEALARGYLASAYARDNLNHIAGIAALVAIERAARSGDQLLEIRLRTLLGNIYIRRGHRDMAEATLKKGAAIGEAIRDRAAATEIAQSVATMLNDIYEMLVFAYYQSFTDYAGKVDPSNSGKGFLTGQTMRAANLATWLSLSNVMTCDSEARRSLRALRMAEVRLEMVAIESPTEISSQLVERNKQATAFERVAGTTFAAHRASHYSPSLEDLITGIDEDALYIDLIGLEGLIVCQAYNRSGLVGDMTVSWTRQDRLNFLKGWGLALDRLQAAARREDGYRAFRALEVSALADGHAALEGINAMSEQLHERLIRPLAEVVGSTHMYRRVILLPYRELAQFPFSGLEELCLGASVSIAPSALCARLMRDRAPVRRGGIIAFGDVTNTLRYVPRELLRICPDSVVEPTRRTLGEAIASAEIVHFAGHGFFEEQNPYLSGLVVAPLGDREEIRTEGLKRNALTLCELAGMVDTDQCALAVLSACSSGVPRIHAASELTSIPAALLVAGVRNVVAALWPAHDAATTVLMDAFYQALSSDPERRPSLALTRARSIVRNATREYVEAVLGSADDVPPGEKPFNHPIYCDAFQHIGIN